MPIECITHEKLILLRIRSSHDDEIDFDELSSMADRLLHGNIGSEVVLSFPDNYVPTGKQMGYIFLWGNTMLLGGSTLGIVTSNSVFIDKLNSLEFAFQMHIYKSEKDVPEFFLEM